MDRVWSAMDLHSWLLSLSLATRLGHHACVDHRQLP